MKRTLKPNSQDAFTMIEIVIAMSILALIMSVTYSSLNQIISSKKLLDDGRDGRVIANAVLIRLTRELQLASAGIPLLPSREDPERRVIPRLSLTGQTKSIGSGSRGDTITFVALEGGQYLPDGGAHSGAVQITYRVEKNPEDKREPERYSLIRDETPVIRPFEKAFEKTMTFPVSEDVLDLRFEYFDPANEKWIQEWGENQIGRLPTMVKFGLRVMSPQGKIETYSTAVALRAAS